MLAVAKCQNLRNVIAKLKRHYGAPTMPTAKGPFVLVMWENACYLLPDDRRAAVFEGVRKQIGLNAKAILKADADVSTCARHDGRHASHGAGVSLAGDRADHAEPV